jgi:hypothetical protein
MKSPLRNSHLPAATACLLLALVAGGCATRQLESDFATISDAYAENMNRQMLLNLARLDQGHPPYFMAIGEVRLARSQSGSLGAGGSSSRNEGTSVAAAVSSTVSSALSGNLSPSASTNASPTFIFIPINSEEAARQLLSPVSIDVFNMLYQQGWPVDQLLRVLVERVEVTFADGRAPVVLVNSPTRGSPASFARFLRMCEVVRELQRAGGLRLDVDEKFMAQGRGEVASVSAGDALAAASTGRQWRKETGGWALGTLRPAYRFRANLEVLEHVIEDFSRDSRYAGSESLANLRALFQSAAGLTVGSSEETNVPSGTIHSVLVLRSFRNLLEAVAQEQQAFDELAARGGFLDELPERQRRPVLRTAWAQARRAELQRPVVSIGFAGKDYAITDPVGDAASVDSRWNRDVFRLLVNLSSQVTVDITKFQRQVLELTQ